MARARPGLQKAIGEILDRHGINGKRLSFRQAERLTGLSPATVSELAKGNARTPETLCRFAAGLGEEPKRLLLLAGFAEAAEQIGDMEPVHPLAPLPLDDPSPAAVEMDADIVALLTRYGRALCALPHGPTRALLVARLQADVELLETGWPHSIPPTINVPTSGGNVEFDTIHPVNE